MTEVRSVLSKLSRRSKFTTIVQCIYIGHRSLDGKHCFLGGRIFGANDVRKVAASSLAAATCHCNRGVFLKAASAAVHKLKALERFLRRAQLTPAVAAEIALHLCDSSNTLIVVEGVYRATLLRQLRLFKPGHRCRCRAISRGDFGLTALVLQERLGRGSLCRCDAGVPANPRWRMVTQNGQKTSNVFPGCNIVSTS